MLSRALQECLISKTTEEWRVKLINKIKNLIGAGKAKSLFGVVIRRKAGFRGGGKIRGHWDIVCRDKNGNIKWTDVIENLVVNAGLDHLLDATLSGGSQITTWYLGLTDGTPTVAAGDTAASHAGWTEVEAYDEANRVTWTDAGVSSQSVDNSGSPATFTISSDSTTVGGAFLISENTKGGSSGTLYAAGAFLAGDKSLDDDDTIDVTATFTSEDDGV